MAKSEVNREPSPLYCQETGELKTYEQVREGSIGAAMRLIGKTKEEAEKMADEMMPKLPRWNKVRR